MMDRKRLLVVEDEEIILADLTWILRRQGYEIAGTASSGPDAVRIASKVDPDLVLMDVRLRGAMSGIEAAQKIQQASGVPVLFVTAHARALNDEALKLSGPFNSISKPFSPLQLRDSIEAILRI
jgi:two-component system, sensor histidine kinase